MSGPDSTAPAAGTSPADSAAGRAVAPSNPASAANPAAVRRTPRERARAQTVADIVRLGREHLAVHGAAALSLRAVARDLGVVSSAVYRYVENRDELLTLLLIDAYGELGDEVDAAVGRVPEGDFGGRFQALGRAVRGWAIREPARYALLFGSPVPGYRAPAERTTGPGTRVIYSLMSIFDAAWRAGALGAEAAPAPARTVAVTAVEVPGPLASDLRAIREELGLAIPDDLLARGALVWTSLFGAISFEVFGQYGADTFSAPDALFEHHLQVLGGLAGLS
jgi:AcrR family transcriptional regulator